MNGGLPPLPPGFTLDQAPPGPAPATGSAGPGELPPLPPGFTLDGQAPAGPSMGDRVRQKLAEQAMKRGGPSQQHLTPEWQNDALQGGREVVRQVGRTGQMLAQGGSAMFTLPYDAMTGFLNLALEKAGVNWKLPTASGAMRDLVDSPELRDRTSLDSVTRTVGESVAGAGGGMALGEQLALRAPGAAQTIATRVGDGLQQAPAAQVASATTGGAAAGVTREMGGGPVAQTIAGMVGGAVPSVPAMVREGVRSTLQGGATPQEIQAKQRQFAAAGTTPSVGQATGGRMNQGAESLLARTPGGAGPMADFAGNQADQIGAAVEGQAARLGPPKEPTQIGLKIDDGVGDFVAKFKDTQRQLYDRLDAHIQPDTRVRISNTLEVLGKLNADIPGAPSTSEFFRNARIKSIEGALQQDVSLPTPAARQLSEAEARLAALEQSRANAVQQGGKFEAFANDQTQRANSSVPVPGMPRVPGRYTVFPDRAAEGAAAATEARDIARARLAEAQTVEQSIPLLRAAADAETGTLPYEAIKKLRTLVGNELSDGSLTSDVPRSKWKALYAALSSDLEAAAKAAGPAAEREWSRANQFTKAGMTRIDFLERVISKNGGPEAVYKAATSNTREGATTLRTVMQSLPRGEQRALAASVIRRLGVAKAGQQNATGDQFSVETFLTNWNNLSPAAKRTLFDRFDPKGGTFRSDMDTIAAVAANLRSGSKVFQNPSGTGQATLQSGAVGGFLIAVLTGQWQAAGAIAATAGTANVAARVMTNPKVVTWLAQTGQKPPAALPAAINQLAQIGNRESDADITALAEAYRQALSAPATPAPQPVPGQPQPPTGTGAPGQ